MVKHKKEPKKGTKAGYAARTADPVLDKTRSDESNSDSSSSSNDAPVAPPQPKTKAPAPAAPPERLNKAAKSLLTIKKRSKQGTRALKEIKRLQKSTDLLIPKAPFLRLIRELIYTTTGSPDYRITEAAIEAMREATESVLVSVFEDSYLLALHAKRVTLFPRDMQLLLRLRNEESLLP